MLPQLRILMLSNIIELRHLYVLTIITHWKTGSLVIHQARSQSFLLNWIDFFFKNKNHFVKLILIFKICDSRIRLAQYVACVPTRYDSRIYFKNDKYYMQHICFTFTKKNKKENGFFIKYIFVCSGILIIFNNLNIYIYCPNPIVGGLPGNLKIVVPPTRRRLRTGHIKKKSL